MDDLHWLQRFIHIFFFNVLVFGLFYILFTPHILHNYLSSEQAQAVRAMIK